VAVCSAATAAMRTKQEEAERALNNFTLGLNDDDEHIKWQNEIIILPSTNFGECINVNETKVHERHKRQQRKGKEIALFLTSHFYYFNFTFIRLRRLITRHGFENMEEEEEEDAKLFV